MTKNRQFCIFQCLVVLAVLALLAVAVPSNASVAMCENAFAGRAGQALLENHQVLAAPAEVGPVIPANVELRGVRLEIDTLPMVVKSESDPRFQTGLVNLLKMLTDTVFVSANKKATLEKGTLRLGKLLDNGQSLEFEYSGDKRGSETVYRLTKIMLVKPNGQEVTLEKNPVSDDGRFLNKNSVVLAEAKVQRQGDASIQVQSLEKADLESWTKNNESTRELLRLDQKAIDVIDAFEGGLPHLAERDQQKTAAMIERMNVVQLPVAIQGPLLSTLIGWIDNIQYLSRQEMRTELENGSVKRLIWKAKVRSNLQFLADVTKKQAFKYFLIGSIVLGYTQSEAISDYIAATYRKSSIEKSIDKSPVSAIEAQLMVDVLDRFSGQPIHDARLIDALRSRVDLKSKNRSREAEYAKFEKIVGRLLALEPTSAGGAVFYLGDTDLKSIGKVDSFANVKANLESGYMVAQFPAQNKMLFATLLHDGGAEAPLVALMIIDKAKHPVSYASIEKSLGLLTKMGTSQK